MIIHYGDNNPPNTSSVHVINIDGQRFNVFSKIVNIDTNPSYGNYFKYSIYNNEKVLKSITFNISEYFMPTKFRPVNIRNFASNFGNNIDRKDSVYDENDYKYKLSFDNECLINNLNVLLDKCIITDSTPKNNLDTTNFNSFSYDESSKDEDSISYYNEPLHENTAPYSDILNDMTETEVIIGNNPKETIKTNRILFNESQEQLQKIKKHLMPDHNIDSNNLIDKEVLNTSHYDDKTDNISTDDGICFIDDNIDLSKRGVNNTEISDNLLNDDEYSNSSDISLTGNQHIQYTDTIETNDKSDDSTILDPSTFYMKGDYEWQNTDIRQGDPFNWSSDGEDEPIQFS